MSKISKAITQETVKGLFDYKDGNLVWKIAVNSRAQPGYIAGGADKKSGYLKIQIDNKQYSAHRVMWLWHHGYFPEHQIDHINRDRSDNRIENLREVSAQCNQRNSRQRKSISGIKGVGWDNCNKKWLVNIKINGVLINLGRYDSMLEAACHRLAAEEFEGWPGCDSNSPAFVFVQKMLFESGSKNENNI